ncbi:uncharacterized protein ASPGLDRAFT_1499984 [Aspergillus glaucus CBS 516.65]|uniref:NmrA-like domain-containing protein n=1 Tax=Aspergillus glaucus CBS 516.65 TaxID=1160497 RepID=A0A1L9VXS6_ASPGL|nr:hypothetical protein ASPGLDRAFT_1499984 [Aspergillus glaucus CBS 516.65]OJJ88705.1 hypothetical protein ASPGLDRAFT_1499984 [Aspergillus glaucus CBS 516.65]
MVNVAIAGGTGGVGRTIFEVLSGSSEHKTFVLSRKVNVQLANGYHFLTVDYSDIDQLVSILEANDINTIICAFGVNDSSLSSSQLSLVDAATKSKSTKRFIPSGFAISYPKESIQILPQLKDYFKAIDILRQSGLQWTIFVNGIFLDYFGPSEMVSYLKPNVFVVDLSNNVAEIPGDGNTPVTFTYTLDLAKYVLAILSLDEWPEESRVIGDEMTWNELVALAEEVKGSKFKVHYDSVEKLKRFEVTELPGHRALYDSFPKKAFQWFMSIFELYTSDGSSSVPRAGSLNERFPDIQPLTVREMLEHYRR